MSAVNLYRTRVNISGLLFFLAVVVLGAFQPALSQTNKKASLTAEREKIEDQLLTTSRLIGEAKRNRNEASSQVALIDRQIELREKLIRHHQTSIRHLERSVIGMDSEIRALEGHISA